MSSQPRAFVEEADVFLAVVFLAAVLRAGAFLALVAVALALPVAVFLAAALLAGAFLAAVLRAGAFLAVVARAEVRVVVRPQVAVAPPAPPMNLVEHLGHPVDQIVHVGDPQILELGLAHFPPHGADERLGTLAARLHEVLDPILGPVPLELPRLDELPDQLFGARPGDLGQSQSPLRGTAVVRRWEPCRPRYGRALRRQAPSDKSTVRRHER